MRRSFLKIAFAIWVIVWIFFISRELFIKGNLNDYRILLSRPLEGKRSYVTGDRLYEFLTFCRDRTPQGATYAFAGVADGSIEKRRAVYYLYPRLENSKPDFIFVYDRAGMGENGCAGFAALDESRYILKKAR
jgi:hypothetical protein